MKTPKARQVTSPLRSVQGATGRVDRIDTNSYSGIPMFCDINLHEACFNLVQSLNKNLVDSKILILGSGGGAFDQRLFDAGYANITSTDFRPDFFKAKGTNFIECDLNLNFTHLGTFDIIVGIEVIEHLENTAHFMRNISQCLNRDGIAIITTPNVESGLSRANFLITGNLSFFTNEDLYGSGHISPIFDHLLNFHAKGAGLVITKRASNRNAWAARYTATLNECLLLIKDMSLRNLLRIAKIVAKSGSVVFWPLTRFRAHDGNINIYVIKTK